MTLLDILLMLISVVILLLCAMQGVLRSLIVVMAFYVATFLAGIVALSYVGITNALTGLTAAIGMKWPQALTYQAIVFLGLGLPMFIGIWFLVNMVLGDVDLPTIKGIDGLLALFVGVALALVVVAVVCNVWGVLVRSPWRNYATWYRMYTAYTGSLFRPYLQRVLAIYRQTLFPFQMTRMPDFLVPQL